MIVKRILLVAATFFVVFQPSLAQDKKGQKLALLVGVRDYDHPEMRPLRYSENDVVELGKLLKEAGYDVTLLADGPTDKLITTRPSFPALVAPPSRANIEKHLTDVLAKCKRREDVVLIAFAGHGMQPEGDKDAYFCPKDANPKVDPKKTMVSLNKVYGALEESFAGVKMLLVDACRDDPKLARGRSGITGDTAPRPPRGVAVLFSCAAGEIAYEHEKYKHGVFFHHVLEGLRGKARDIEDEITFTSLASYVSRAVSRDVPKLVGEGAQQSPNLKADLAGAPPVLLSYTKKDDATKPPAALVPVKFHKELHKDGGVKLGSWHIFQNELNHSTFCAINSKTKYAVVLGSLRISHYRRPDGSWHGVVGLLDRTESELQESILKDYLVKKATRTAALGEYELGWTIVVTEQWIRFEGRSEVVFRADADTFTLNDRTLGK